MTFSIVIPTYDSAKTIQACLSSVLTQTFSDYEILIMDGLSQDNTLDIIRLFEDEKIKIFSEKDNGVYDAMNKGIALSKGEWLFFLGSDDELYDTEVLEKIDSFAKSAESAIIYGDAYFVSKQCFYDGEFTREKLFKEKNICHQAIFYKREVFEKLGFYNLDFYINADWDFNLRCFSNPSLQIKYIELPIVNYNDATGLSSCGLHSDVNFHKVSGAILNKKIREQENYIKELEVHVANILKSKYYRLGHCILKPFKMIKKFTK